MRDLMAITARPDVISLAGGLPDTSSFPPETFAALTDRIARESCAAALQYGPTEGFDATKSRIVRGDGSRGHARRSRRHRRDDRRSAGDRPGHQDADRPGRRRDLRSADVPGRGADVLQLRGRRDPDRDGLGRDAGRPAGGDARAARPRRAAAEVHLHGAHLPEPRRRDAVGPAPPATGRDRPGARAAGARGQPVRAAALRGRAAAAAVRDRRRRVRALSRDVLQDPVTRGSGSDG